MASRQEQKRAAREARERAERDAAARDARTRRMRLLGIAGAVAAIVVVVAIVLSSSGSSGPKDTSGPVQGAPAVNARFRGVPQEGTTLGRPDAPVTLTEFADLKCPYCREFSLQALPTLVQDEVRRGHLRIEFHVQTFVGYPGDSERAARFALAAGNQGRFWQFADLFYVNQGDERKRYVTDDLLRRLGTAIPGLDVDRAMKERNSPAVTARLRADSAAFQAAGFNATPSFLLGRTGGRMRPLNPTSLDAGPFTQAIDQLAR